MPFYPASNSAGSEWVDKEVRHFMKSGREEYIIPFIVDGEPAAREEGQECYPAALRTEGEGEFLGIGVKDVIPGMRHIIPYPGQ